MLSITKEPLSPLKKGINLFWKNFYLIFLLLPFYLSGEPDPQIEIFIHRFMEEHQLPGAAIVIVNNGEIGYYLKGYENLATKKTIDAETLFEIGSITKVFTAECLAIEILHGKMHLNDRAIRYIPELQETPYKPFGQITLQHLATHTASLPRMPPGFQTHKSREFVVNYLKKWKAQSPIGSTYEYSNLSFGLLGWCLADLHQQPYYQVVKKLILTPLKMSHTFINIPEESINNYAQGYYSNKTPAPFMSPTPLGGGGALRSNIKDMTAFLLCNMGQLGPNELKKAFHFSQKPLFKVNEHLSIGLGWQIVHRNDAFLIDKNGATNGFSSYIGFLPEQNKGIVLLTNQSQPNVGLLGRKILFYLNKH